MSVKQGIKYDAPESAKDIPTFIEFHNLNADEIRDPINSFKNFNEFFYRYASPRGHTILPSPTHFDTPGNSNPTLGRLKTPTIPTDLFPVQTVD